jgi:HSP20 family protein
MSEKTMEIEKQEEQSEIEKAVRQVRRNLKPRIDLYEADEVIMLVVDLPGVKEEDIDITLENDRLTIYGTVEDRAPEGYRRVYSEFCYGDFKRSFVLSNEIDRDNIEASFDKGVLTLSLPKAETAKARKIALQSTN